MGDLAARLEPAYSVTVTISTQVCGWNVETVARATTSHRVRTASAAPTNGTPLFGGSGNDMNPPVFTVRQLIRSGLYP